MAEAAQNAAAAGVTTPGTGDAGQQQGQQNQQQQQQQAPADKTFTQADVDRIVQERLAREKARTNTTQPPVTQNTQQQQPLQTDDGRLQTLEAQLQVERLQRVKAEVKASMPLYGFQPEKVDRGVNLVDLGKVVDDKGVVVPELLKAELEQLAKDFPEWKVATQQNANVLKIGADGNQQKTADEVQKQISAIFGNAKS